MSVEYLGKVNNIVTVEKLKELTGMTVGNYNSGDITFLKFNDNGKELLIADRCIANSTSWNVLDGCGVVSGKVISVNESKYICRLITGGDGNASSEDNSEWKRLIVDIVPNTSDSNWKNMNTICQETYYGNSSQCIIRGGYTSVSSGGPVSKTANPNDVGWRPVFEKYENISITGINDDLGEISSFNGLRYNIVNNYNTNFNLTEKVDGQVIRNLNNQSNGEFTFNIENFDSLAYGSHTIEIIADDPTASGNVTVTSKFNKIKSPVQPIPTNSNLKQVMLHNKEIEKEISYQKYILVDKLKSKYINVSTEEPLSTIIQKIGAISPITQIGEDVILFNKSSVYVSTSEYSKALEFESFTYGDFKIKSTLSNYGSYGLANAKIQHTSSDGLVKFEKVVANDSGNGSMNFEIDILNVLVGDKIVFNLKGYTTSVGAKLTNTNITCGKVFK